MAERKAPGFLMHLRLLWGLRLDLALSSRFRGQRALAVLAFLSSSSPAPVLGFAFYRLMLSPPIAHQGLWPEFILGLLGFVTTCLWVIWPMLSAGVDDHSELSRFAAFPISGLRLMLVSTLASLFEPRALVVYAPLLGASLGYLRAQGIEANVWLALLFAASVLLNAALSRLALNTTLNVLRQPRSAELIGLGFVGFLAVASQIPPVDVSWVTELNGEVGQVPQNLIENAAEALTRIPSGYLAHGLARLSRGSWVSALRDLFALAEWTLVIITVAYGFLLSFYRASSGSSVRAAKSTSLNVFARTRSLFSTLLAKEALDLWHNPRARMLATVPFVLTILLKLLSARALAVFVLGPSTDGWMLGSLCIYSAVVMASTFAQNTFAYDGHGLIVFYSAPIELPWVLRAKNCVHGAAALAIVALEVLFYSAYVAMPSLTALALSVLGVLGLLPVLLCTGNWLSVIFPVKFHSNLKRRDRLPFVASMLGVAGASLGSAPWVWVVRHDGSVALLLAWAVAAWAFYFLTWPQVARRTVARREQVLVAVTRE